MLYNELKLLEAIIILTLRLLGFLTTYYLLQSRRVSKFSHFHANNPFPYFPPQNSSKIIYLTSNFPNLLIFDDKLLKQKNVWEGMDFPASTYNVNTTIY